MSKKELIKEVESIKTEIRKHGYLTGSSAWGLEDKFSDYDYAMQRNKYFEIKERIDDVLAHEKQDYIKRCEGKGSKSETSCGVGNGERTVITFNLPENSEELVKRKYDIFPCGHEKLQRIKCVTEMMKTAVKYKDIKNRLKCKHNRVGMFEILTACLKIFM